MSRIVLIGGTSTIAQHIMKIHLAKKDQVILYARNLEKIANVTQSTKAIFPTADIEVKQFSPESLSELLIELERETFDIAYIAIGHLLQSVEIEGSEEKIRAMIESNVTIPTLFLEKLIMAAQKQGFGKIGLIGSVAGDRGRKRNYLYGSSKAFLERLSQGVNHHMYPKPVSITLIKPGPTRSAMTHDELAAGIPLADPAKVAAQIVRGVEKRKSQIYTPRTWRYIMLVIKLLPTPIFNRLAL